MFGLFGIRTGLILGGTALLGLLLWGGYMYVNNLQTKLEAKIAEIAVMSDALKTTNETLKLKQEEIKENLQELNILNGKILEANEEMDNLRKLLSKHDLTRLAIEKPGLIEKRINDASNKTFDDIERITSP